MDANESEPDRENKGTFCVGCLHDDNPCHHLCMECKNGNNREQHPCYCEHGVLLDTPGEDCVECLKVKNARLTKSWIAISDSKPLFTEDTAKIAESLDLLVGNVCACGHHERRHATVTAWPRTKDACVSHPSGVLTDGKMCSCKEFKKRGDGTTPAQTTIQCMKCGGLDVTCPVCGGTGNQVVKTPTRDTDHGVENIS